MCKLQVVLVDRAGRRTLTIVGLGGMCCCTVAMTVGMAFQVCLQWMCLLGSVGEASLKLLKLNNEKIEYRMHAHSPSLTSLFVDQTD